MTSILNSISSGDLQVQQVPGDIPTKEDSIIDLLQNSEIEFTKCPNPKNPLDDFNTGFGENSELHYSFKCPAPKLRLPLYKENYFSEFVTEEDKAKARKALGILINDDSETTSKIVVEDGVPSTKNLNNASIKHLKIDSKLFTPTVSFKSVFDSSGTSLEHTIQSMLDLVGTNKKALDMITAPSGGSTILSLKDMQGFLQGFSNGDTLQDKLEAVNKNIWRFEQINN